MNKTTVQPSIPTSKAPHPWATALSSPAETGSGIARPRMGEEKPGAAPETAPPKPDTDKDTGDQPAPGEPARNPNQGNPDEGGEGCPGGPCTF